MPIRKFTFECKIICNLNFLRHKKFAKKVASRIVQNIFSQFKSSLEIALRIELKIWTDHKVLGNTFATSLTFHQKTSFTFWHLIGRNILCQLFDWQNIATIIVKLHVQLMRLNVWQMSNFWGRGKMFLVV